MLEERIYRDYVEALKARDKHRADFLSFIRAELKNAAISLRKDKLDDTEVIGVLKKQKKRLLDTKESIPSSGRDKMREEIEREIAILESYLPQPLSPQEMEKLVSEVIADVGATSIKDMGKVMKEVLSRSQGRADARQISEFVKQKLTSS